MIISRSPLRITLGGGGTDLPSFYQKYGGFLIAGAINKHNYVGISSQFYNTYALKYSKIEIHKDINLIQHNLIREALKLLNIKPGVEITSLADIPSGTGLGSSGAFLVALLNTLHQYQGTAASKRQLANEACKIEIDILKEHEGKQDKYVAAFGGLRAYQFDKDESVSVIPFMDEDVIISELETRLFLYFTGQERKQKASDVLKHQDIKTKQGDDSMIDMLTEIKNIGFKTRIAFETHDFYKFGQLLDEHWQIKKQYSPTSTSPFIDTCYKIAIKKGALGGKICGAGGGGFFMFYHPGEPKEIWEFHDAMKSLGLYEMKYNFDREGVITIIHERENYS